MRRFAVSAAIVLAAGVAGCGPAKEVPEEVVKPETSRSIPPDPLGPAPAKSDPEAKAVLDRAVKAVTQGDPARLAKVKATVATYKGGVHFPTSPTITDATLRLEAAWPHRAQVTFDFKGAIPTMTFRLVHPEGWRIVGGQVQGGNPASIGEMVYADVVAKHALPLGLTLADERTVAFEPKKSPEGTEVKVATPGVPVLRVTFDPKTDLPGRVEYNPLELSGDRVLKVVTLADYKPQDGVLVPTRVELEHNGRPAEKWALEKWEFLDKIDLATFEPPGGSR